MKNTVVSERYAQALFELTKDSNLTEQTQEELRDIAKVIKNNKELSELLFHPIISKSDKKEILEKLLKDKVSSTTLNFLLLLVDKKREGLIEEISELFDKMVNNLHSKVVAQVYTAIEVQREDLDSLKNRLEEYLNKNVEMKAYVDDSIMGGVLVKIGDRVIDGTLKTKFENMSRILK
ncbi:MAG: F0F1 ATP synthase subunit delta [Candidatus Sericytochromatia bacterium]